MARAESERTSWRIWLLVALVAGLLGWALVGGGRHEADPSNAEHGAQGSRDRSWGEGPSRPVPKALGLSAAPRARITGTITEVGGGPLVGATVCAKGSSRKINGALIREPFCTRSVANGRYAIENLLPIRYTVTASAARHIPASFRPEEKPDDPIEVGPGQSVEGIDIALESGGVEVQGEVRDLSGGEIEGATVSVSSRSNIFDAGPAAVATSDAAGRFSVWVAPGTVQASGQADGYAYGSTEGRAPGTFLTIRLTPESVLVGRVVDAQTGAPVEGVRVSPRGSNWFGEEAVTTGPDGAFRVDRLSPGRYKPTARGERGYGQASESVELGLGQQSDPVLIKLYPAAIVEARVQIGESDRHCADGSASLEDPKQDTYHWSEIDDEGHVRFEGVLAGSYTVSVRCEDHPARPDYEPVVVQTEDVSGLVWPVDEGFAIRGIVVDAAGAPLAGISLRAQQKSNRPGARQAQGWTTSEPDGTFKLGGLLAGDYAIRASGSGKAPDLDKPVEVTLTDRDLDDVKVTMLAGGTVRGTVVDEDGAPVKGATVSIEGAGWNSGPVSDDGGFEFEGVKPGRHRVVARTGSWTSTMRAPNATDDDLAGEPVEVEANQVTEVSLVVARRTGAISGMVVDEGGGPITDAFVSATRESDSAAAAAGSAMRSSRWNWRNEPELTDTDGRFEIEDLEEGLYTVRAYRRGGGEAMEEHVQVGASVTLGIDPTGSVAGKIMVPSGDTPSRFHVSLRDPKTGMTRGESFFQTDGTWSFDGVPAGTYHAVAMGDQGTGETKGIELREGQAVDGITISLEGRGRVHGKVVDAETGEPLPDMLVIAAVRGGGFRLSTSMMEGGDHITKADGTYTLDDVAAGPLNLRTFSRNFDDSDYSRGMIRIKVTAGQDNEAPPIELFKRRVDRDEKPGDLGFKLKEPEPDEEPEDRKLVVAFIRPGGPAAKAGLTVGDELTSIDGHEVGGGRNRHWGLLSVKPGRRLTLGLADGRKLELIAGPPL